MQGKFLHLGGDEQHSQAITWLWGEKCNWKEASPFLLPNEQKAKFKSKLRAIKSSGHFQQLSTTGEGFIPTGDVAEVKDPFWPAVQCVEEG